MDARGTADWSFLGICRARPDVAPGGVPRVPVKGTGQDSPAPNRVRCAGDSLGTGRVQTKGAGGRYRGPGEIGGKEDAQFVLLLKVLARLSTVKPKALTSSTPALGLALFALGLFVLVSHIPRLDANAELDQVTLQSHSRIPGARTTYEVSFVTPGGLDGVKDSIVMELHGDIGVPTSIRSSSVTVTHSSGGTTVHGHLDEVSLLGQADPDEPTVISIAPSVKTNGSTAGIPAGAAVRVTFTGAAGISNPSRGGAYSWLVSTTGEPAPVAAVHPDAQVRRDFLDIQGYGDDVGLLVERTVNLSQKKTVRGEEISVTASGFREGLTLWVWRDQDADGQQANGEAQLCQATVGSGGTGQCSFEVRAPPFTPVSADCLSGPRGCNLVNAADGVNQGLNLSARGSAHVAASARLLELAGKVEASTAVGSSGELQVRLSDFPSGTIASVTLGGLTADVGSLTVGPSGRLSFGLPVPAGVKAGQHQLEVGLSRDDNGEVYSSSVIVEVTAETTEVGISPEMVVANRTVAIWGKGFSTREGAAIRDIQVGGEQLEPARINYGQGFITVDPDGSWAGTISLPVTGVTIEPGDYSVDLVDTHGYSGSVEYTVGAREMTVSPERGRPGSIVEVSGRGFPASNQAGSRVNLLLHYDSAAGRSSMPAQADHEGNFTQEIRVPLETPSPSANAVRVEFETEDGEVIATAVAHEILEPEVEVFPASGPPGATVSLTGGGFRHHLPVTSVTVGGMDVLHGDRRLYTDASGRFSLQFTVPAAVHGPQPVRVDVSGTIARSYFQVSPGGSVSGNATPASEALAGLGDRLEVVFHFDNLTKGWSFFDPLLGEESDLRLMIDGELYFVLVTETVKTILNGRHRTLTCHEGNCWNVILW